MSNSKTRKIELEQSWLDELLPEFQKNYMLSLRSFLIEEKKNGKMYLSIVQDYMLLHLLRIREEQLNQERMVSLQNVL